MGSRSLADPPAGRSAHGRLHEPGRERALTGSSRCRDRAGRRRGRGRGLRCARSPVFCRSATRAASLTASSPSPLRHGTVDACRRTTAAPPGWSRDHRRRHRSVSDDGDAVAVERACRPCAGAPGFRFTGPGTARRPGPGFRPGRTGAHGSVGGSSSWTPRPGCATISRPGWSPAGPTRGTDEEQA
nr:hypothetical protein [Pseudonocardia cytotoxica]